ncbi:MAG: hypothetical protein U0X20_23405 [Caldilineaceae bacterium]
MAACLHGAEALDAVAAEANASTPPILDSVMPILDGVQLAQNLRNLPVEAAACR